ncbi:MAG: terminase small subunit [Myxococcota bacterium]
MSKDSKKLTEKQRRFVEAYLGEACGNATQSARLAGYKGNNNTLRVVGAENLAKPAIQEAIASAREKAPPVMTPDRIRAWWMARMGDPDFGAAARIKASELLARSIGMFVDRVEHSGAGGGPIQTALIKVPANELFPEEDGGHGGDGG